MSRLKPQKEYEKTGAFRFFRWLSGSKDPYLGEVEMQPQKEFAVPEAAILDRMNEKQMIRNKVYDVEKNKKLAFFHNRVAERDSKQQEMGKEKHNHIADRQR